MLQLSLATLCCLLGATGFYLTFEKQKLIKHPPPRAVMYCVSGIGSAVSITLLNGIFGPATSVFYFVTILMLVLTIAPLAIAYAQKRVSSGASHE